MIYKFIKETARKKLLMERTLHKQDITAFHSSFTEAK